MAAARERVWTWRAARHSNIGLQLDQYHASMSGEDPVEALRENFGLIAHVQIADAR